MVNARALYDTLDDQQKAQVTNTASLEKAEGYIYQLKADALKAMLKALPDAQTVRGYEAPQPTTVPSAQEAASVEEEQAVPAQSEGSDFSDGSADAFSSDEVDEQAAETVDIPQAESAEDTEDVQTDVDFSSDEEVPAAGDTSKRELTEAELKQIAEAKNAYDRLTETEEKKFRSENTALVENMEKLLAMALTYEKGQSAYQQFFADEAAQIYATVKDHPVDRDSYADVKAFLDRYAKDYQGQEDAMAGLKVKVGSQEMTFAEVIAALTAQADKAGKDISDAQQADEWISNLPTAVTKENIANVEAELAALQKLIDRGVWLDVGHGSSSFDFDVFERAAHHPLPRFLMGTDLHQSSVKKLVRNMAVLLSKLYGCGVSLEDILYGVTTGPAMALGLTDWCRLSTVQNATLFRIVDHTETYEDCQGNSRTFHKAFSTEAVILNGEYRKTAATL